MKRCSTLLFKRYELKLQWDTIFEKLFFFYLVDWQRSKSLVTLLEGSGEQPLLYNAGGSINWYKFCGEYFGSICKNFTCTCSLTQQVHYWAFYLTDITIHTCTKYHTYKVIFYRSIEMADWKQPKSPPFGAD